MVAIYVHACLDSSKNRKGEKCSLKISALLSRSPLAFVPPVLVKCKPKPSIWMWLPKNLFPYLSIVFSGSLEMKVSLIAPILPWKLCFSCPQVIIFKNVHFFFLLLLTEPSQELENSSQTHRHQDWTIMPRTLGWRCAWDGGLSHSSHNSGTMFFFYIWTPLNYKVFESLKYALYSFEISP